MWRLRSRIFAGIFLQAPPFLPLLPPETGSGIWLCEEVLRAVPHRHFVFSIPKILRRYFLYDRKLLSELSRCAWEKEFFQEVVPEEGFQGPLLPSIRSVIS